MVKTLQLSIIWVLGIVLLAPGMSLASETVATDNGFYYGVLFGEASFDLPEVTDSYTNRSFEPDDDSTAGAGLIFGYNPTKYVGFEFGGAYFSEIEYGGNNPPTRNQYMLYLALMPKFTYKKFTVFGRVGAAYLESEIDFDNNDTTDESELTYDNGDPIYGAGIAYRFSNSGEVGLSYNKIPDSDGDMTYIGLEITHHSVTLRNTAGFLIDDD